MAELLAGVDVGGSKVAAGLVTPRGELVFHTRARMEVHDAGAALQSVVQVIEEVCREAGQRGVRLRELGLCAPGPLDLATGRVLNAPNLPCWHGFPLVETIENRVGLRVYLENDANAAGLAEALWGAGRDSRILFYATLGTGLGTALLVEKTIFHGGGGYAVEAGHLTLDYNGPVCGCGKRGCAEVFCAGPAIARRAHRKVASRAESSTLARLLEQSSEGQAAEPVVEAFRQGDELARGVLEETADLLGIWLGCVMDLFDPDRIVLGGGLSGVFAELSERIAAVAGRWALNPRAQQIPLGTARYGAEAGIAGAAALVLRATSE
jgi:glucokinase